MFAKVLLCSPPGEASKGFKPSNYFTRVSMAKLARLASLLKNATASLPGARLSVAFFAGRLLVPRIGARRPVHIHSCKLLVA